MQIDRFEIQENSQTLQYFSFIRQCMESCQLNYWIGNPSVSILNGTLYLHEGLTVGTSQDIQDIGTYFKQYIRLMMSTPKDNSTCRTLILNGVPNSKAPSEVFERFAPYLDWILEIQVIKTNCFQYYGILLLMKDRNYAINLCSELLGEEYNGLEKEVILLREVDYCTLTHTGFSQLQKIYQPHKKSIISNEEDLEKISSSEIFKKTVKEVRTPRKKENSNTIQESPKKMGEAATCSICFEDTDGPLASLLCSHCFHVKCLFQWKQNKCPLCRYHQQPPVIKFCQKCNQCQGLWICLVCGVRLCCGETQNILGPDSHIYEHYQNTQHRLSMQMETKFVFDASQPAFLHQLLYRQIMKNDEGQQSNQMIVKKGKKSKLSDKISEYEQSISEQMHKQRIYFEQNINKQTKNKKEAIKQKKKQLQEWEEELGELQKSLIEADVKKQYIEDKTEHVQRQLRAINEVQKYWKRLSNKNQLAHRQEVVTEKQEIRRLDNEIQQKREQLKDLMRNQQLSGRIIKSLGSETADKTLILETNKKDKKKKK